MRLLKDTADDEIKSMTSVVNGVSRIAWTTALPPKPTDHFLINTSNGGTGQQQLPSLTGSHSSSNSTTQSKMLKNILNALQLSRVDFSISRLDDHSKVVFPVLFAAFTSVYWSYYFFSSGGTDAVDVF